MLSLIYEITDLQCLREYLIAMPDCDKIRECLFDEFLRYSQYRNATEWNKAVRICECLSIIGWGCHEPLEAIRSTYFNGNPNTFFINRNADVRFYDAVWSKRKEGVAIDPGLSCYNESPEATTFKNTVTGNAIGEIQSVKLDSQRNWVSKNPVCLTRGLANCYENSKAMIESMEKELQPALNRRMRPDQYGNAINRIILNCSFSFYDNYHCKTNYIIADESLRLKQKDFYPALLAMFSEKEIEDNGYYLRNRFTYSPFRSDTGTMRVGIVLEKEFSEMPEYRQRQVLSEYLLQAANQCAKRLHKKINYNFSLMITDFSAILKEWCHQCQSS